MIELFHMEYIIGLFLNSEVVSVVSNRAQYIAARPHKPPVSAVTVLKNRFSVSGFKCLRYLL